MHANSPVSEGHHVTLLVKPWGQVALAQLEHTLFVEGVQLTEAYFDPITHGGSQGLHALCPSTLEYVPGEQALQDELPVVCLSDEVPGGHCWQMEAPLTEEKFPGAHSTQDEAPCTLEYLPGAHIVHAEVPLSVDKSENEPWGHRAHAVARSWGA